MTQETTTPGVVIIGAGHAGFQTARSLRDRGYEGTITVVDAQHDVPYQRPPLSKAYLLGTAGLDDLQFAAPEYYADNGIELRLGTRVSRIDRDAKRVVFTDDSSLGYEHLVLATGAKPRELQVPGADAKGVHVLRTLADADAVTSKLATAKNVVVIGAGFIGLEFVSIALKQGVKPVVLEFADRVLGRVVSRAISNYFAERYTEQGAQIMLTRGVASIETENGHVVAVVDSAGDRYEADLVVAGIGVLPETTLAEEAGLEVENGIVVDRTLGTSDPHISAVGDCSTYPSPVVDQRVRLESVQNATDHGRCVALKIVGTPSDFAEIPWFWSDQGDKKLQIAGLNYGYDTEVVRGDPANGGFSVFMYQGDKLVAVDSVDRAVEHMAVRRLMMTGRTVSAGDAGNPEFDLKAYSRQA